MIHPVKSGLSKLTKISYYKAQLSINKARIYLTDTDGHSENCAFVPAAQITKSETCLMEGRCGFHRLRCTGAEKDTFCSGLILWSIRRIEC